MTDILSVKRTSVQLAGAQAQSLDLTIPVESVLITPTGAVTPQTMADALGTPSFSYTNGVSVVLIKDATVAVANVPVASAGTALQIVGGAGNTTRILVDAFANIPTLTGRRADGTPAAPTAVQKGDTISQFTGTGFATTDYAGRSGSMRIVAAENFTDTANGTRLSFSVTKNGTLGTSNFEALGIENDGAFTSTPLKNSTTYTDDAAAAAGGVAIGQIYRNGSVVQIRIT